MYEYLSIYLSITTSGPRVLRRQGTRVLPLILLVVTTSFDLKTGSSGEKVVADVIDHGPLRELWVALSPCLDCPGSLIRPVQGWKGQSYISQLLCPQVNLTT